MGVSSVGVELAVLLAYRAGRLVNRFPVHQQHGSERYSFGSDWAGFLSRTPLWQRSDSDRAVSGWLSPYVCCAGGDEDSLAFDMRCGMDKFVHLCFVTGHPMAFRVKERKPDAELIYLQIDRAIRRSLRM